MSRLLPFSFLLTMVSLFGLAWIVTSIDPDSAPWYIFALFVFFLFLFSFNFLGLILYFARTRFYRRYSSKWYVKTSFKMAFFVAVFLAIVAILAILKLVSIFNILLLILAISFFAFWSYLGRKN